MSDKGCESIKTMRDTFKKALESAKDEKDKQTLQKRIDYLDNILEEDCEGDKTVDKQIKKLRVGNDKWI